MNLNNNKLIQQFSLAVLNERKAIGEVISYLSHILDRKLFAEMGYPSLFNFLIEKYQYSKAAAYRRIQAAKLAQREPKVLDHLRDARLNLTTIGLIEPFAKGDRLQTLINSSLGRTKEEVEELLSELSYKVEINRDRIRRLPNSIAGSAAEPNVSHKNPEKVPGLSLPLYGTGSETQLTDEVSQRKTEGSLEIPLLFSDTGSNSMHMVVTQSEFKTSENFAKEARRVKIEFVADESVAKKIERAQEILRHKYPRGKLEDIINEALEVLLDKRDPWRKIARMEKKTILVGPALHPKQSPALALF